MRSLRSRLVALVLGCLAAVIVPLATISYLLTIEEVDELGDARLAQNARTISALAADFSAGVPGAAETPLAIANWRKQRAGEAALAMRGHRYETQIGFQYWNGANVLLMHSQNMAGVALDAAPAGFADIPIGNQHWRVFTLLGDNQHWVRVGERDESRREIARALAIEAIAPLAIGLPLLALLMGWAVQRGLKPLRELAERIGATRHDATDPLGVSDAPREVEPIVFALNGLLGRLRAVLRHERAFTAHAAHELRTPLAGALLHIENARAAAAPDRAAESLRHAETGLRRLDRIVNQMLELARMDAASKDRYGAIDLRSCVEEEFEAFGLAAAQKNLEIVVRADASAPPVRGSDAALRGLVRNLLDNAVRHSPPGGRLDVSIEAVAGATRLTIADQGPGMGATRRATMLERFQRGDADGAGGGGLGLAIVARVAELHRATVHFDAGVDGLGLRVSVDFATASA